MGARKSKATVEAKFKKAAAKRTKRAAERKSINRAAFGNSTSQKSGRWR